MMPMNLKDYVKVYDNFLDLKTCKKVVKQLKKLDDWHMHTFYTSKDGKYVSYDKELSISNGVQVEETAIINQKIWFTIEQYILKDFDYMKEWFGGWTGYQHIRYNRYDVDTRMKLHCDHIHSLFDGNRKGVPILSVLGSLNDDYEGGDLIFWEQEKIELKAGQIMVFPSNFMYPHKVTEVTKGTRYSFVSWVW